MGGGRLREVSLIAIWLTQEPIGILVRWSLIIREVVAQGGSTLFSIFFFCEESLVRDTNQPYKDCSEMHSGSCSQMTSSCIYPIVFSIDVGATEWRS